MSSPIYFGTMFSLKSHSMSSSSLSNMMRFFNLPTHASYSHFLPDSSMSRCTSELELWLTYFAPVGGICWAILGFLRATTSTNVSRLRFGTSGYFFAWCALLLSYSCCLVTGGTLVSDCLPPGVALSYFGMLTYNFNPPKTILSNRLSSWFTSSTPLNLAKLYLLPFLFLLLDMKISLTSPTFFNCCHSLPSVASSGKRVK